MALTFGVGNRSIAFAPTSAFPLNANSYFESLELAQAAAASAKPAGDTSTKYYFGQEIVVVDLTSEVKTAQMFIISPTKDSEGNEIGELAEVGGKIEVNENTFVLGEDGVLNLYGYADAESGAQLVKGSDGKLSWVVPSNETVEGLQTTVATLQEDLTEIQQKLNPTDEKGNPLEEGIVYDVETLKSGVIALGETIETIQEDMDSKANAEDVYTKSEVETQINSAIGSAGHLKRIIVEELPDASTADADTIYMLKKAATSQLTGDYYEEHMVIKGAWELIGNTYVDLSDYVTSESLATELNKKANSSDVYTKSEADALLEAKATTEELAELTSIVNQNKTALADKADSATTLAGYGILDAYTKEEVNNYVAEQIGAPAVYEEDGTVTTPASGIYANTYTRNEIQDLIADITGGESAADVLAALNAYKGTNDAAVKTINDKLVTIAEGAQVNVLEAVKIEGEETALEIAEKTVTLPAATIDRLGLVKLSAEIANNEEGALEVKSLNVNKLVQSDGDWLILNGGTSAL